jgi:segregation and condensation protein B
MSPRKRSKRPAEAPTTPEDSATSESASESNRASGEAEVEAVASTVQEPLLASEVSELRADDARTEDASDATEPDEESTATAADEAPDADTDAEVEPARAEPPAEAPTSREHRKRVLESLVFVSDQIITAQQLARIVKAKSAEVRELLLELVQEYAGRGIELVEVSSGFQFRSAAASAPFVRDLVAARPVRLTRAQLETLALVAYRQPITRPEIDDVRGVDSGSALKVLLERGLLKILGRKDEAGRPLLYGTAPYFLEFFGLRGKQELPTLREFTDLTEENRALFQRKTGEAADFAAAAQDSSEAAAADELPEIGDEELFAIAEAAKRAEEEERGAEPSLPPAEREASASDENENVPSEIADDDTEDIEEPAADAAEDLDVTQAPARDMFEIEDED